MPMYLKTVHPELIEAEITGLLNTYFQEHYDSDSNIGKLAALTTRREFLTLIRVVYEPEDLEHIDSEIARIKGDG